jgi:serine/threonine-protein kinase
MGSIIGAQLDNYRILEKVGEGGMGSVYRAIDVMLERDVALKFLRPELSREPELVQRFRAEAVMLARLNHHFIAPIFGLHRYGDELFIAMEYVPGETLDARLKRIQRFTPDEAMHVTSMVLQALDYAHRLGVVHRDIKPGNVIITPAGTLKVMDFGIARVIGQERRTRAGAIVGTIAYMAPEQIQGMDADQRADIYSVGTLLYEMLTGHVPFQADTDWALMQAQINVPPRPLSEEIELPAGLEAAVLQSLEKSPDKRFPRATDFQRALENAARQTRPTDFADGSAAGAGEREAHLTGAPPVAGWERTRIVVSPGTSPPHSGTSGPSSPPSSSTSGTLAQQPSPDVTRLSPSTPVPPGPHPSSIERAPAEAPRSEQSDMTRLGPPTPLPTDAQSPTFGSWRAPAPGTSPDMTRLATSTPAPGSRTAHSARAEAEAGASSDVTRLGPPTPAPGTQAPSAVPDPPASQPAQTRLSGAGAALPAAPAWSAGAPTVEPSPAPGQHAGFAGTWSSDVPPAAPAPPLPPVSAVAAPVKAAKPAAAKPTKKSSRVALLAGAAIVVAIAAIGGWFVMQRGSQVQEAPAAAQPTPVEPLAQGLDPGASAVPQPATPAPTPAPQSATPPPVAPPAPSGRANAGAPGATGRATSTPAPTDAAGRGRAGTPPPASTSIPSTTPIPAPAAPLQPPPAAAPEPIAAAPQQPAIPDVVFRDVRMIRNNNGPEVEVQLQFGGTQLAVTNSTGRNKLHALDYSSIASAQYHESRHTTVFVRTTRYWLHMRGQAGWELQLRLERDDVKPIISALEQRWGRQVETLAPEQEKDDKP